MHQRYVAVAGHVGSSEDGRHLVLPRSHLWCVHSEIKSNMDHFVSLSLHQNLYTHHSIIHTYIVYIYHQLWPLILLILCLQSYQNLFIKIRYLLSGVSLVVLHSHGAANLQHGSLDNVQKLSHLARDWLEVVPWAQTKHETNGLHVLMHVKKNRDLEKDWYELSLLDGNRNDMFIARQWSEQLFNLNFLVAALDPSDRTQVSLLMTSWQLSKKSPWKHDCVKRSSKSGQLRI